MIERTPGMSDAQYIDHLTRKLREAEDTLEAIRTGSVDALFIDNGEGVSLYTLESADRPYRTLIEQMQEGALSMSPEGVILYGNQRLCEILQQASARVVGREFFEFVTPAERARFLEFLAASADAAVRGDFNLLAQDGSVFPAYLSFRALDEDTLGSPIICGIVTDLTQQRLMEARLSQAQKMEALGQLTGGLAHDFNNLLQGIKGSLDLIIHRSDSPRVPAWAEAGLKAADRGAKLTAQLLAFSRSQKIELKPLVINEVIVEMTDLLKRTLGSGVLIHLELEPTQHWVLSDPTQFELAILNLALNARDAMTEGGELRISTRHQPADIGSSGPGEMRVCIADNGSGMPEDVRLRAFNPFYTTKVLGAGTGLGLAQVQSIVEQSSGAVHIESQLGQGTQVYMTLPCTHVRAGAHELPAATREGSVRKKRILVIDDDNQVRRVVIDMLEMLGHQVHESASGQHGLQQIEALEPDLVLLDFAMPNINGAEVARRARIKRARLPIIFISGFSDTEQLEQAVGASATVLRKPFTIAQLQTLIDSGAAE